MEAMFSPAWGDKWCGDGIGIVIQLVFRPIHFILRKQLCGVGGRVCVCVREKEKDRVLVTSVGGQHRNTQPHATQQRGSVEHTNDWMLPVSIANVSVGII